MNRNTETIQTFLRATKLSFVAAAGLATSALAGGHLPDLGPNTIIFEPSMSVDEIEAVANGIHAQQVDDEMGSNRYALMFMPGVYGTNEDPLQISVGYYTEVIGLGASPKDVVINGKVEVRNRCFDDPTNPEFVGCFALNNFWRGLSNMTILVNGAGQDGCTASGNFWAVSQAVSMRRVTTTGGNLTLMDYCTGPSFASGGYIADSTADFIINGSQQQWYVRDSAFGGWSNAVWNQVFTGVEGAPTDGPYPTPPYTVLETTALSREKPYLYVDGAGDWFVRVSDAQTDSRGITWAEGFAPGRSVPLDEFHIVEPGDSIGKMNTELAKGRNLLITPGMYDMTRGLELKHPDTVVLGIGIPTLTARNGSTPITIKDNPGIIVAGLTVDAGPVMSDVLLQVGKTGGERGAAKTDPSNPITLNDIYFRVGGPYVGKTETAMQIDASNVLIDHTWVWRGDHGVEGFDRNDGVFGDNARWREVIGNQGVIVNGDDVTATGLFVEHFQKHNLTWNGERGRVYFFQNELPYDPPSQADWTADDGSLGWAAYKVADGVQEHLLWGGGVYVFNRNDPSIRTDNGYEVPEGPGISLNHIMIKNLSGPGIIDAIVNGVGTGVDGIHNTLPGEYEDPEYLVSYP